MIGIVNGFCFFTFCVGVVMCDRLSERKKGMESRNELVSSWFKLCQLACFCKQDSSPASRREGVFGGGI